MVRYLRFANRNSSRLAAASLAIFLATNTFAPAAGGQGLFEQIKIEHNPTTRASRLDAEVDLYLDVSGSSAPIKKQLGKLGKSVVSSSEGALDTNVYYYGNSCTYEGNAVSTWKRLSPVMRDWDACSLHDTGTNLGRVFDSLRMQCKANPGKSVLATVVSDGGFEDVEQAHRSAMQLAKSPNIKVVAIVGITSAGYHKFDQLKRALAPLQSRGAGLPPVHVYMIPFGGDDLEAVRADLAGYMGSAPRRGRA